MHVKGSLKADAQAANIDYKESLHASNNYRVVANIFVALSIALDHFAETEDEVVAGHLSDFAQQCIRDGLAFALREGEAERQKYLDKLAKVPSFKIIRDSFRTTKKDHEDVLVGKEEEYKQSSQTAHLIAAAKSGGGKGGGNGNNGWKKQGFRKGWKGNSKKPFQKGGSGKPAKPSGNSTASQQ
ncbi:hypothetical protein IW150_003939 [Coemansia sp. RSA 2607]|nr:hypothetical protein IW150_003939 [Coemansia sp. RSA 2607]